MTESKGSQYPTEQDAILSATGLIYKHYKGGIYRLLFAGVMNTDTGVLGVVHEHIWPHAHSIRWRPQEEFFGRLADGRERFVLLDEVVNLAAHIPIAPTE